jgi:c-di-GMP-binding flagellar brake protein YcgR
MNPAPRYQIEFPTAIQVTKSGRRSRTVRGTTFNMSLTGLGVLFPESTTLRPGDVVRITLKLDEMGSKSQDISFRAEVVWQKGPQCGLEIRQMSRKSELIYVNLLTGYKTLLEFTPLPIAI